MSERNRSNAIEPGINTAEPLALPRSRDTFEFAITKQIVNHFAGIHHSCEIAVDFRQLIADALVLDSPVRFVQRLLSRSVVNRIGHLLAATGNPLLQALDSNEDDWNSNE